LLDFCGEKITIRLCTKTPYKMLVLNEQVKPAKDTIFTAETTIKNIHKKDNKTLRKVAI